MNFSAKKPKLGTLKMPLITILILTLVLTMSQTLGKQATGASLLSITTQTDKQVYLLRQEVLINGSIQLNGLPASDLLVTVVVTDPQSVTMAYRTLQIGNPSQTWPVTVMGMTLTDTGNNPIDTVKMDDSTAVIADITFYNPQITPRSFYATITVFDAAMRPIWARAALGTVQPYQTATPRISFTVPKSATSGRGLIVGDVYSDDPRLGGQALSPETTLYYMLSKTSLGLAGYSQPPTPSQNTPGKYNTTITLPPNPKAGTYNVFVLGQASPILISSDSTTFTVQNSSGYPPQASFAYQPDACYLNMTVNFDGSFSTPEGYNDVLTRFEWNFGDGTPKVVKTGNPPNAYTTHNYMSAATFIISLNATDNEGMWSVTSKPITILPESGPTASFTWIPPLPYDNDYVNFSAAGSTPGWFAALAYFSPIINYTWDFGDGTPVVTTPNVTITHMFGKGGNFTVILTAGDLDGRIGSTSNLIQVSNSSSIKVYDVTGDGKIDVRDIYAVGRAFGSQPGYPNWNPLCDFNKDNKVDMRDYYPVCRYYGKDP